MNPIETIQNIAFHVAAILCISFAPLKAQSLDLQSFSCAGDQLTSTSGISLSSILGEIVTEKLETSNLQLTQGFHQLYKIVSQTNDIENTFEIILYPNPTLDNITLQSQIEDSKRMVYIYDSYGQQVNYYNYDKKTLNISFSKYPSGQYYVIVRDKQGRNIGQIPFQKINI